MPLGIVSDFDLEKELNNSGLSHKRDKSIPIINGTVVEVEKGRGNGSLEVPDSLRKIIGETSELDGRKEALDLAHQFGISPSSVSAYSNGSTSTSSMDKQPNLAHINQARERISKRARKVLNRALENITEDKLEKANAPELAHVARSMGAIVKDMEPEKARSDEKTGPQFIFYAPQIISEQKFETVYAKE